MDDETRWNVLMRNNHFADGIGWWRNRGFGGWWGEAVNTPAWWDTVYPPVYA